MNPSSHPNTHQILTSMGPAAIAVIRICGPAVEIFLQKHLRMRRPLALHDWTPGRVWRGELLDVDGAAIDDLLISVHAAPPIWDLRLHLHGSPFVVRHCAELLKACGLRGQAEDISSLWPTEDPLEAEAYARLPQMRTERGARWLLHQVHALRNKLLKLMDAALPPNHPLRHSERSEESCPENQKTLRDECRAILARASVFDWFARPLRVALVGPPNAGKSTLANALADQPASLVSPVPGTTRDWVEIPAEIQGFPVVWIDTAGLRVTEDPLEAEGVARTRRLVGESDAVLMVLDTSETVWPVNQDFLSRYADRRPACAALNKSDLVLAGTALQNRLPPDWRTRAVPVSALRQMGLAELTNALLNGAGRNLDELQAPAVFTMRQVQHLEAAIATADARQFHACLVRCLHESSASPA